MPDPIRVTSEHDGKVREVRDITADGQWRRALPCWYTVSDKRFHRYTAKGNMICDPIFGLGRGEVPNEDDLDLMCEDCRACPIRPIAPNP